MHVGMRVPDWLLLGPREVLGLLLLAALLCRLFWLERPRRTLIFDERFYVNAARVILGWRVPQGDPYAGQPAGLDPNHEHPPLGKLLIAGSMRLFGDNPYGWRIPSLLAGMGAIILVYAIVRTAGGDGWLGAVAAAVLAFDNLVFVHSRIATLDMPMVALLLLGVWCWLRGWRLLAGMTLGLAGLVKLGAIYGLAAPLLLELGRLTISWSKSRRWSRDALQGTVLLVAGFVSVWLLGLWLLDLAFTTYKAPWDHLHYMLHYGFSLARPGGPANYESRPWQWLANEVQIPYLRVAENLSVHGQVVATRPIVDFRGAMNPFVIGAAPLGLSYAAWRAWRFRDRLSLWVVAWFVATYLSFFPLVWASNRTTYIFYFLPTLPAVAVAIAQLLRQSGLPRVITWGYTLALLVGFLAYFPFRHVL
jgi:dolichyl-phosphate-mannose-protein mannosyltransferase